jgi:glutathione peroxidase
VGAIDYATPVQRLDGSDETLEQYRGKVLLIVNTASRCGFTPQYEGLEALQRSHGERGLVVLGFPCDQFGKQEPGSDGEIQAFCEARFGVTFPMHAKIDVNGAEAHPLFVALKASAPGVLGTTRIKWNFTKFLVDRRGEVVARYAPMTEPGKLAREIERLLAPS